MKTVTLTKPGSLVTGDVPDPLPLQDGEALVRVHRVGICGTDLHAFRGRQPFFTYPRVLGHELGVEVMALASTTGNVAIGDRCAVEPYLNCGACVACRRGKTNCCVHLKVLGVHIDGGMCEYLVVPAHKLHSSTKLTLEELALVETLAIGAHAVDRGSIQPGELVLVLGAGPIGLSVIQFIQAAGGVPLVMDLNADRLSFCQKHLGVKHVIKSTADSLDTIESLTQGDLPAAVFDATGNPQSMMESFKFVSHGGRLIFVGLIQGDITFHDPHFHRREVTLLSSRNALAKDFRRIIRLIEEEKISTAPWITHRATLAEVPTAFASWLMPERGVIKAMVDLQTS